MLFPELTRALSVQALLVVAIVELNHTGIKVYITGIEIPAYIIAALVMDDDPRYIEDKSYGSSREIDGTATYSNEEPVVYQQTQQYESEEPVGFKVDDENN